jgi:hypothetical protein
MQHQLMEPGERKAFNFPGLMERIPVALGAPAASSGAARPRAPVGTPTLPPASGIGHSDPTAAPKKAGKPRKIL